MAELNLDFAIFNPGSGNGDQAVSVSASKHTGRVERSISAQVATDDGSVTKQVTINQAASVESVTIDETASVAKTGGTITINGKSNSSKLTFAITAGKNPLTIAVPATYTAAGKSVKNGEAIADDPGATAEYNFSVTFTGIPANATVGALTATLKVTDEAGNEDSTVITQAAGDPTLKIDKEVINLDVNGTAQTLQVTSNTKWSISQIVNRMFSMRK